MVTCGDNEPTRAALLEELEDATYAAFDLLNERDAIEEFLSGEVATEDGEGLVALMMPGLSLAREAWDFRRSR